MKTHQLRDIHRPERHLNMQLHQIYDLVTRKHMFQLSYQTNIFLHSGVQEYNNMAFVSTM